MIHHCVDLDHLADIASLSPLKSCLPSLFTLYFVECLCSPHQRNSGAGWGRGRYHVSPPWRQSVYRNYLKVCAGMSLPTISISTNSFILPLGCNPVLCNLLLLKLLSVVATGGSSPLAPVPLHMPHQWGFGFSRSLRSSTRCSELILNISYSSRRITVVILKVSKVFKGPAVTSKLKFKILELLRFGEKLSDMY